MEKTERFGSVPSWEDRARGTQDGMYEISSNVEIGIALLQDGKYVAFR